MHPSQSCRCYLYKMFSKIFSELFHNLPQVLRKFSKIQPKYLEKFFADFPKISLKFPQNLLCTFGKFLKNWFEITSNFIKVSSPFFQNLPKVPPLSLVYSPFFFFKYLIHAIFLNNLLKIFMKFHWNFS